MAIIRKLKLKMLLPRRSLIATLLILAAIQIAPAEDDVIVEGPFLSLNERQGNMRVGVGTFDQMVFQQDGDAKNVEQRILTRAKLQLAELDHVCQLTDPQKHKLQLAIQGDLQRLLSEAAPLRLKFNNLVKDGMLDGPNAMEIYQQLHLELRPLQTRIQMGLTDGPSSLFTKVLSRTLTAEQQAQYDVTINERRRFRFEASIAVCLLNLEEVVYLSESHRERITELLLAMPPPRHMGQYESYIILGRMGAIPREKLESLFTPRQWRALSASLEQYRTTAQSLVESGYLDPDDIAPPVPGEKP